MGNCNRRGTDPSPGNEGGGPFRAVDSAPSIDRLTPVSLDDDKRTEIDMSDEKAGRPPAEQGAKWSQLIARCWADDGFKKKLLADPETTLEAEGMEWPAGLSVKVLADDDKLFHLVIPARPTELSDEDLERVAGGMIPDARMKSQLNASANPLVTSRDRALNS